MLPFVFSRRFLSTPLAPPVPLLSLCLALAVISLGAEIPSLCSPLHLLSSSRFPFFGRLPFVYFRFPFVVSPFFSRWMFFPSRPISLAVFLPALSPLRSAPWRFSSRPSSASFPCPSFLPILLSRATPFLSPSYSRSPSPVVLPFSLCRPIHILFRGCPYYPPPRSPSVAPLPLVVPLAA